MPITINLLGEMQLTDQGAPIQGLRSDRARALVAIVVMEGGNVSRSKLLNLLNGDQLHQNFKQEFRRILSNVRKQMMGRIESSADNRDVILNLTPNDQVDILDFDQLTHRDRPEDVEYATQLYRGELLQGFSLENNTAFDDWLQQQRQIWDDKVQKTLQRHIENCEAGGDLDGAVYAAHRLLELHPWDEKTHARLMLYYAKLGQLGRALNQYESCKEILSNSFSSQPMESTNHLRERIQQAAQTRTNNLPVPITTFVGRDSQIKALSLALKKPDNRLVTIAGFGGMGKTRLALEVASQIGSFFLDGALFIPAEDLGTIMGIVVYVATALKFEFDSNSDESQIEQLTQYLKPLEILLIFDNYETILEHEEDRARLLISQLLTDTTSSKVLVTSRERLNLSGELLYPLSGMNVVPEEAGIMQDAISDSVKLFISTATRVQPNLSPDSQMDAIAKICEAFQGMPLAIKLAAGWINILSPTEILEEIELDLDILSTDQPGVPQRHQSLRQLFESTWKRLTQKEQIALAKLSIFPTGFDRNAAVAVADTSLSTISSFTDQSVLQQTVTKENVSRFQIHPVLKRFIAEKLDEIGGSKALHYAHSRHFAQLVNRQAPNFTTKQRGHAITTIATDIANVRQGWRWVLRQQDLDTADLYIEGLYLYNEIRGQFRVGYEVFTRAVNQLCQPDENGEAVSVVCGRAQARLGWFAWRLGMLVEAEELAENSLKVAKQFNNIPEQAFALLLHGVIAFAQGRFSDAIEFCESSANLWKQTGNRWGQAVALLRLGSAQRALGDYSSAAGPFGEGLIIYREIGHTHGATTAIHDLPQMIPGIDELIQIQELWQQTLALQREINDLWGIATTLEYLAQLNLSLSRPGRAAEMLSEALDLRRGVSDNRGTAKTLIQLARVLQSNDDFDDALGFCIEACEIARQLGDRNLMAGAYLTAAEISYLSKQYDLARKNGTDALSLYQILGERAQVAAALTLLGFVTMALYGAESESYFKQSLHIAFEVQAIPAMLDNILGIALSSARDGNKVMAEQLCSMVIHHSATRPTMKAMAQANAQTMGLKISDLGHHDLTAQELQAFIDSQ